MRAIILSLLLSPVAAVEILPIGSPLNEVAYSTLADCNDYLPWDSEYYQLSCD